MDIGVRSAGAALLIVAAAWGWVEAARANRPAGDPTEATALAAALKGSLRPGELGVVRPTLLGLGTELDALPVMPAPPPHRGALAGRYRAVALADLSTPPSEGAWRPEVAPGPEHDGLSLLPIDGPFVAGERLLDRLAEATVELVPPEGPPIPCTPWTGSRHRCGPDGWMQVGRAVARVGGSLVSCIWAHPQEGLAVRLTFPRVSLGRALRGSAALVDGTGAGADVHIAVTVDGERAGGATLPGRTPVVTPLEVPTRAGVGTVVIEVSAESSRWRQVCIDPVVEQAPAGEGAP